MGSIGNRVHGRGKAGLKCAPAEGRRGCKVLWRGALAALLLAVGPGPAGADLFDGLEALRDSLRAWERQPPGPEGVAGAPATARTANRSAETGPAASLAETTALPQWFPGAAITPAGDSVRIDLPPLYRDRFAAGLWAHGLAPAWTFSVDMETRDSLVALDGRVVPGLPADAALAPLRQGLPATLAALRALAVPGGPPVAMDDSTSMRVKLVGVRIDTFRYEPDAWWRCARALARGMRVYAFLVRAEVGADEAALTWAIFLREPDRPMQHLIEWRQQVALRAPAAVRAQSVRLVPGVRLDNVDELVAPPGPERPGSGWPLRIEAP